MNRQVSVYLDAVRFFAAVTVLLGHIGSQSMSGGFLWQSTRFGTTSVVVFFVLSGFVIRHAALQTSTARDFFVSRASRIYSVVLPTLGLTLVLDMIGSAIRPNLYQGLQPLLADPRTLPAALSFLNCAWGGADWSRVGSNCSYWSLGYEVPYYALFGFLWFGRGMSRVIGLTTIAVLTGPHVLLLSSLWFLGVGAHWLCSRWKPGPRLAWWLFSASGATVLSISALHSMPVSVADHSIADLAWDALVATAFAVHVIACQSLPLGALYRVLDRFEKQIRWAAGSTFTLYMLHFPLALFFKSLAPWPVDTWQFRTGILLVPLLASFALAEATERKKQHWRHWIDRIVPGHSAGARPDGAGPRSAVEMGRGMSFPLAARMKTEARRKSSAS